MKLEMNDVKSEQDVRHVHRVDAEGLFHVIVTAVDDSQDKYEAVIVDMKILAGTDGSQVARNYREYFFTSESATPRLKLFGLVTGAARPGQVFEVMDLIGKQAIIEIKKGDPYVDKQSGEKKVSFQTGWGTFWRLDDEKVAHVPRGVASKSEKSADTSPGDTAENEDDWDDL